MAIYYDDAKKSWYCKFRYTDWTGKSRHTTKRGFRTKREAKAYELDFKRGVTNSPDMSVSALLDKYIEMIKGRHKERTVETVTSFLNCHVRPKLGTIPLSSLTTATMIEWQTYYLSQVAPSTARSGNQKLLAVLNYAVKMNWLDKNPLAKVGPIGVTGRREVFWTFEQYQLFRKTLKEIYSRKKKKTLKFYLLCFDVLFFSGLRKSEFFGLGADDIEGDVIHVRKAFLRYSVKDHSLKNASSRRDVPMPHSIMERVWEYIAALPERPDIRLFQVTDECLRQIMRETAKKAGLPYITLHGLRHSHVSHLISQGIPITVISRRVGHASTKITLGIYSHMYESDSLAVSEQLEKVVGQMLVNSVDKGS